MTEIACTLSEDARRARARDVRAALFPQIATRKTTEDGIKVQFHRSDSLLQQLADYIAFESRCCAFLRFDLVVESRSNLVTLRLTGPEGTSEFVKHWFEAPATGA